MMRYLILAIAFVCASACLAEKRPPNVIFLITDDQMPDTFNFLPEGKGKNLTPTLDRLASEGTVMMGQHVVSPVCTPSRYNCLTGKYASRATNSAFRHGTKKADGQTVVGWNSFVTTADKTVAHYLRDAGYKTGFVGKNHVVEVKDYDHIPYLSDPEHADIKARLAANAERVSAEIKKAGFDYTASVYENNPSHNGPKKLAVHNMDWVAKGGLDFIDQSHDKPFFLYLATTVPHGPMERQHSWDADPRATAEGILPEPLQVLPPRADIPKRLRKAGKKVNNARAMMLTVDDMMTAIMAKLERYGVADNTIIIYFNDHGQRAKGTLYQGGVYNPSVIWKKGGFDIQGRCEAFVSNIDFAPTILDFAGVKADDAKFDGVSFRRALEEGLHAGPESLYFEMGYTRAVRVGDWKLLCVNYPKSAREMSPAKRAAALVKFNDYQKKHGKAPYTTDPTEAFSHIQLIPGGGSAEHMSMGGFPAYYDTVQLYHLKRDPGEQKNLAKSPEHQEKLAEMLAVLNRHIADLPGTFEISNTTNSATKNEVSQ